MPPSWHWNYNFITRRDIQLSASLPLSEFYCTWEMEKTCFIINIRRLINRKSFIIKTDIRISNRVNIINRIIFNINPVERFRFKEQYPV